MARINPPYQGFEQGPIRPPSEARSLLIRITRNCPWNRCTFCSIYKQEKFSIRPVEDVKKDIETVSRHLQRIMELSDSTGAVYRRDLGRLAGDIDQNEIEAFNAALNWFVCGMKSIFLQDANSLVIKTDYLVEILSFLKEKFPQVDRITSYARSHSLARISDEDLIRIKEAGLNRIHVGLETGSDTLLKLIQKGSSKEMHIVAGQKVKNAGMELSEYIMPGLGGSSLSKEHALETADALNQIDPHFIRLRTLIIPPETQLFNDETEYQFKKSTDIQVVEEIRLLIENLNGITSTFKSDHIANLLQMIEGTFPDEKTKMLKIIEDFFALPLETQIQFQVGRRFGFLLHPDNLKTEHLKARVESICQQFLITPENVDEVIDRTIQRTM
ncbi:radical SAM protein [bacterium]|nr:radical SAM protein [bacterium]